jgi:biotin-(acetyl-CoA carboxylase) ligase
MNTYTKNTGYDVHNNNQNSPLAQLFQMQYNNEKEDTTSESDIHVSTHPMVQLYHVTEPIGSTQDEARKLLLHQQQYDDDTKTTDKSNSKNQRITEHQILLVIADQQTAGRGTNGRQWEGTTTAQAGTTPTVTTHTHPNLYMTMGVAQSQIPVLLTLLPLQIAVLVANRVNFVVQQQQQQQQQQHEPQDDQCTTGTTGGDDTSTSTTVHVKWPNDVLINDAKVAGTLIESVTVERTNSNNTTHYESWFLIGIGVNIHVAPSLDKSPGKHGRPAIALQDVWRQSSSSSSLNSLPPNTALYFGMDVAYGFADWIVQCNNTNNRDMANQQVIQAWKANANLGSIYEIRSSNVNDEEIVAEATTGSTGGGDTTTKTEYQGEQVIVVDLHPDGRLKVRNVHTGKERLLVSDYFF